MPVFFVPLMNGLEWASHYARSIDKASDLWYPLRLASEFFLLRLHEMIGICGVRHEVPQHLVVGFTSPYSRKIPNL